MFPFFILLLTVSGCKKHSATAGNEAAITLRVDDVASSEAWLKITSRGVALPVTGELYVNNTRHMEIILAAADTMLYVANLPVRKNCEFVLKAQIQNSSNESKAYSSPAVNAVTLDTTSHSYTWQAWAFGDDATSDFYDVAIIAEDDIWVVGQIYFKDSYTRDSAGRWIDPYNIAHWDGQKWSLMRSYITGRSPSGWSPIQAVSAVDKNNVYFGNITKWNGSAFVTLPFGIEFNSKIRKIWGSSPENIAIVGFNGSLANFNGTSWKMINTGTKAHINDIYGITGTSPGSYKAYISVSNIFELSEHKLLTLDENLHIDSIPWNQDRRINSSWTPNGRIIYTSGGGVFDNKRGYWRENTEIPLMFTECIRGNGLNDVFTVGDFGLAAHYNGANWKVIDEIYMDGVYLSVAMKNNLVVAVGIAGSRGIIKMGRRQ
ncbi:MAG: hypothetical protein HY965_01470 [Ignavibacteriales bacterium]|nr:hypothetical protein [Ignavibacteriales bacterium]